MALIDDKEVLLFTLRDFIRDNIGAKIDAINAEKNDGITLRKPEATDFFVQSLNQRLNNSKIPIYIGFEDPVVNESVGPSSIETDRIQIIAMVADTSSKNDEDGTIRRALRYQRVLKELIENNWNDVKQKYRFKVSSVAPISFQFLNSSNQMVALGIELEISSALY